MCVYIYIYIHIYIYIYIYICAIVERRHGALHGADPDGVLLIKFTIVGNYIIKLCILSSIMIPFIS